ncbi:hypothetical protein NM688_g7226 [Phlebia brevispora]|uniref:Uncharacterized protein n=1 Tax=Phlebia brevispora TaxID=194682 RepID=A0ACC1S7U1_9APHY|nr:hypothetical protein NM688_g7226 [Phlebia brevispora]
MLRERAREDEVDGIKAGGLSDAPQPPKTGHTRVIGSTLPVMAGRLILNAARKSLCPLFNLIDGLNRSTVNNPPGQPEAGVSSRIILGILGDFCYFAIPPRVTVAVPRVCGNAVVTIVCASQFPARDHTRRIPWAAALECSDQKSCRVARVARLGVSVATGDGDVPVMPAGSKSRDTPQNESYGVMFDDGKVVPAAHINGQQHTLIVDLNELAAMNVLPFIIRNRAVPHACRSLSTISSLTDWATGYEWKEQMQQLKPLETTETLHRQHLSNLFVTLPTRDGAHDTPARWQVGEPPQNGTPLPFGHHLVFFHQHTAEKALRPDGTDPDFCPPEPYTRRMWAGGEMSWVTKPDKGLLIGSTGTAKATIADIRLKTPPGGDNVSDRSMVFVDQDIEYQRSRNAPIAIKERRTHVYLPSSREKRTIKQGKYSSEFCVILVLSSMPYIVKDLPKPTFSFSFLPTPTTLFRFSALTFNAHHIHLDLHYAVDIEGYAERLVHGPLTALMLLEVAGMQKPSAGIKHFKYRAVNPLIVNMPVVIKGIWEDKESIRIWAESGADGTVGMTGRVTFYPIYGK